MTRMQVNKAVQLAVVAAVMLWWTRADAATSTFKLCGRKLSEVMSRVCHVYNSPTWDVPTVVEQPASVMRRKRETGIADECCTYGCTWEQLTEYCAISDDSESILESLEAHMISDRSAEQKSSSHVAAPAAVAAETAGEAAGGPAGAPVGGPSQRGGPRREVGRGRSRGSA